MTRRLSRLVRARDPPEPVRSDHAIRHPRRLPVARPPRVTRTPASRGLLCIGGDRSHEAAPVGNRVAVPTSKSVVKDTNPAGFNGHAPVNPPDSAHTQQRLGRDTQCNHLCRADASSSASRPSEPLSRSPASHPRRSRAPEAATPPASRGPAASAHDRPLAPGLPSRRRHCVSGETKITWSRRGSAGRAGTSGLRGAAGTNGTTGNPGASGSAGATGATGAGSTGSTGTPGSPGTSGATGPSGATGAAGPVAVSAFSGHVAGSPVDERRYQSVTFGAPVGMSSANTQEAPVDTLSPQVTDHFSISSRSPRPVRRSRRPTRLSPPCT